MSEDAKLKKQVLRQVAETHQHYCSIMEERLADEPLADVELYFGLVAKLVGKLEDRDKPLRAAAQEMVAESAASLMSQLGGR